MIFKLRIVLALSLSLALTSLSNAQEKRTQVVLKVQDMPFNKAYQTEMKAPYVEKASVMIPNDLHGTNKWIMFEGPVLENDKIAYRIYADSRHRFDIYAKKVSDLVMDTVSWNYHNIMDWGSDILKVGNSLGMGSPGIFYEDTIYTLSEWSSKKVEILEDGNNRSSVRTTFTDLKIGGHTLTIVEEWSIEAGNFYCTVDLRVVGGELPEGMYFATGIVKHLKDASAGQSYNSMYAYTYGEQSYHQQDMGMAIMASNSYAPREVKNDLSHLYVFDKSAQGVTYRFMSKWAEGLDGPKSRDDFEKAVADACKGIE